MGDSIYLKQKLHVLLFCSVFKTREWLDRVVPVSVSVEAESEFHVVEQIKSHGRVNNIQGRLRKLILSFTSQSKQTMPSK